MNTAKAANQCPILLKRFSLQRKRPRNADSRKEEEGKRTFHSERLPNDSSRQPRESRPIGAELKFHWNSRYHPENEIYAKDAGPEARGIVPFFVSSTEKEAFEYDNERSHAHGELRKQIVECNRERKLNSM